MNTLFILFLALLLFLSSPSCRHRPVLELGTETGVASWYGEDFHGRPTSAGEIYNMHDMTAAHPTLPFGTLVMVTNLENGKSAVVRINDRGPFVKGRVIDLSWAAANVLGMAEPGTARVRLEVLNRRNPAPVGHNYYVQAGSFILRENAEALAAELRPLCGEVFLSLYQTPSRTYYRVRIRARSSQEARDIAQKLSSAGYTVLIVEEP